MKSPHKHQGLINGARNTETASLHIFDEEYSHTAHSIRAKILFHESSVQ